MTFSLAGAAGPASASPSPETPRIRREMVPLPNGAALLGESLGSANSGYRYHPRQDWRHDRPPHQDGHRDRTDNDERATGRWGPLAESEARQDEDSAQNA